MTSPHAIASCDVGSQIRSGLSVGDTVLTAVSLDLKFEKWPGFPSSAARRMGVVIRSNVNGLGLGAAGAAADGAFPTRDWAATAGGEGGREFGPPTIVTPRVRSTTLDSSDCPGEFWVTTI